MKWSAQLCYFICIGISVFVFGKSYGQNRINEDSLLHITVDPNSTNEGLIQAHNRLSRFYLGNDTSKANYHLDRLVELANYTNDTTALIMSGDLRMRQLVSQSLYLKAKDEVYEMLRLSKLIGGKKFEANCYNSLGVLKSMQYQEDSVLYFFEKSYKIILELPNQVPHSATNSLINLGATALRYNKYEKALKYYLEALEKSEDSNYDRGLSMVYSGLGLVHEKLDNQEESRLHQHKALVLGRALSDHNIIADALHNIGNTYKETIPDSAMHYYQKALCSYEKLGNSERIGLSAMAMGDALFNSDRPQDALRYFKTALQNYKDSKNRKRIIDTKSRISLVHFEIGNYNKARSYMDEIILFYNSKNDIESRSKAYGLLSKIAEQTEELPLALSAQRRHQILKDSLNIELYNKEVAEITSKYESDVQEAKIEKQKIIIAQKESQNEALIISAVLGGLLLIVGLIGVVQRNKKNKEILFHKAEIQSQKIEKLEKEKEILSINAMIQGQEAERSRIAKDLHDGLGGLLSTVKAHFSNIQSEIQKIEKINVYKRANELVDEACIEVRRISHNLMPGALRLKGLKTAVEHLGDEMSAAHSFKVRVETIGMETRMVEAKEVFIYRIIQESLNNIIKHAEATDVFIQLSETDEEYHFIVEDNGEGFDPLQIKSGLGLKSIQSRVEFLKGELDIDTKEGVGTTLSWHIPK